MCKLKNLRFKLHQNAELAFKERKTGEIIKEFISFYEPDTIVDGIAGTGMAFVFKGLANKPKILFRADLDALPINEPNEFEHRSHNPEVSHKCGHDGHMVMVASIAEKLPEINERGDIILLFQPAEEIGAGAIKCMEDDKFSKLEIDYVFGLHNIPESDVGEVLYREGTFACGSVGLKVKIKGHSSHAAQPELANSPFNTSTDFFKSLEELNSLGVDQNYFICTLTYLKLGTINFGVTPGELDFCLTLRAQDQGVLDKNKNKIISKLKQDFSDFELSFQECEAFPTTTSSIEGVAFLKAAIEHSGLKGVELAKPLSWSEDFGHFTQKYKGAYFGLGAGGEFPLHHPEYDFNDGVIPIGQNIYLELIKLINGE